MGTWQNGVEDLTAPADFRVCTLWVRQNGWNLPPNPSERKSNGSTAIFPAVLHRSHTLRQAPARHVRPFCLQISKYCPFLIWNFRQFFLVLSLSTSWKSPLAFFLVSEALNYKEDLCYTWSKWWKSRKQMVEKSGITSLPWKGGSWKDKTMNITLQSAAVKHFSVHLPPCPWAWQWLSSRAGDSSHCSCACPAAPPALPPSGHSTGPWSGPCRAHSLSLLVLMLPLKPFFPAGKSFHLQGCISALPSAVPQPPAELTPGEFCFHSLPRTTEVLKMLMVLDQQY